jgi:Tfp pilus assembly protein PilF
MAASAIGVAPYFLLRPSEAGSGIPLSALGPATIPKLVGSFGYQVERLFAPVGFWPYLAHVPTDAITITLATVGGLAAVAGLVLPDRGRGLRRFSIIWILIATALPVVVVLADFSSTPVAEHRLYLAVVGLALLCATGFEAWAAEGRLGTSIVIVALLAMAAVTVHRNRFWHDELSLWTAVTERVRTEPLPYLNLGLALADAGRKPDAEAAYRRALALDPNETTRQRLDINLGLLLVDRGALDEAQHAFDDAIAIGPHAIAYRGLGMIARKRAKIAAANGDQATAIAELTRSKADLDRALAINPRYYQARYTLAGVLYDAGQYRAALAEYQRVVDIAGDTDAGREAAQSAGQIGAWLAQHPEAP